MYRCVHVHVLAWMRSIIDHVPDGMSDGMPIDTHDPRSNLAIGFTFSQL